LKAPPKPSNVFIVVPSLTVTVALPLVTVVIVPVVVQYPAGEEVISFGPAGAAPPAPVAPPAPPVPMLPPTPLVELSTHALLAQC
jgi:hypothetical protein